MIETNNFLMVGISRSWRNTAAWGTVLNPLNQGQLTHVAQQAQNPGLQEFLGPMKMFKLYIF